MSNSSETSTVDRLEAAAQRTTANSRVIAVAHQLGTRFANSRIRAFSDRFLKYASESFMYQWLTTEPDPEVVVIDLRETYTVGPVIRLFDAAIAFIRPYWHNSRIYAMLAKLDQLLQRAAETRPGRVLVELLEPPEQE